jgi:hypothetical protein
MREYITQKQRTLRHAKPEGSIGDPATNNDRGPIGTKCFS